MQSHSGLKISATSHTIHTYVHTKYSNFNAIPFKHLSGLVHGIVSPDNGTKSAKNLLQNILQFLHPVRTHLYQERGREGGRGGVR